jgi:hypothetical protein
MEKFLNHLRNITQALKVILTYLGISLAVVATVNFLVLVAKIVYHSKDVNMVVFTSL